MGIMTFEQFQVTGRDVADLRSCNNPDIVDAFSLCDEAVPGRVYFNWLYVSRHDDSQWNCLIANTECSDRDLAKVERFLYDWALSEGYFENGHGDSRVAPASEVKGVTRYSQPVKGTRATHNMTTRFDMTDGVLGISQWEGDVIAGVERVLLSKRQVQAMLEFIREQS